jgi:hypothetical protein
MRENSNVRRSTRSVTKIVEMGKKDEEGVQEECRGKSEEMQKQGLNIQLRNYPGNRIFKYVK